MLDDLVSEEFFDEIMERKSLKIVANLQLTIIVEIDWYHFGPIFIHKMIFRPMLKTALHVNESWELFCEWLITVQVFNLENLGC